MNSEVKDKRRAWAAGTIDALPKKICKSQFEQLCEQLGLDPDGPVEFLIASPEVQQFCIANKDRKFIPEQLLHRLNLRADADLYGAPALCQEAA